MDGTRDDQHEQEEEATPKRPQRERVSPGVWRLYRPTDAPGKPKGSFYTESQVGWKISAKGKRVPARVYLTADSVTELRAKIDDARQRHREGLAPQRRTQSLVEYLRGWLCAKFSLVDLAPEDFQPKRFNALALERVAPAQYKTATTYNGNSERHIIPAIGAYPLGDVTPEHVQQLVNRLAASGKVRTAGAVCELLSSAFNDAKERRLISWSPMQGVRKPRYVPKTRSLEPLTAGEMRAVLAAAEAADDPLRALWWLSAATGCRPGELLGLHRDDVHVDDVQRAFVVIRRRLIATRGGGARMAADTKSGPHGNGALAIDSDAAGALVNHLNRQQEHRDAVGALYEDQGLLFATGTGTPLLARNVARAWKRALVRAKIETEGRDTRFYALRHTNATTILEAGHDIKEVQARLRHSSLSVLNTTYAHVRPARDAAVARSLGSAYRGQKGG